MIRKILVSEKELSAITFKRLEKALVHKKNSLTDSDNNIYLTDDSLIHINNRMTGSNNNTLRKVNVKPYGYDKMYMDKDLTEDKLYLLIDKFHERKINHKDFYSKLIDNIHPFYDENGKT